MRTYAFTLCTALTLSCSAEAPFASEHAEYRTETIPPPPKASASIEHAPASSPTPSLGRTVTPRIEIVECDEPQTCEAWPAFAYHGIPAISSDGRWLATVEERNGWGNVAVPGIRLVDLGEPRVGVEARPSSIFLPLAPPYEDRDGTEPQRIARAEAFIAKATERLSRQAWHAVDVEVATSAYVRDASDFRRVDPDDDPSNDAGGRWDFVIGSATVSVLTTGVITGLPHHEPVDYKEVAIARPGAPAIVRDISAWNKRRSHCSSPHLDLVAASVEARVLVLTQQLGGTTHACDAVDVPFEYRVIRW